MCLLQLQDLPDPTAVIFVGISAHSSVGWYNSEWSEDQGRQGGPSPRTTLWGATRGYVNGHPRQTDGRESRLIHKHTKAAIDFAERAKVVWRIRPPFADSWIVVDHDRQLKRLKEFDQRVISSGRGKLTTECSERYQRGLTGKRQELTRFICASGNMALFCYEAVSRAVDIFYAERRAWYPSSKKVMKDLAATHPHLHDLVSSALRTDREQVRSTMALLDFVLLGILAGSRIGSGGTGAVALSVGRSTNDSVACLSDCRVLRWERHSRGRSTGSLMV